MLLIGALLMPMAAEAKARRTSRPRVTASKGRVAPVKSARAKRGKKGTRTAAASRGKSRATRAVAVSRPAQPSPERYREIQQALAERGYLTGPVTGAWDADSQDALRRFQREQNLKEGRLDSRTIISLGLGPQRAAIEAQTGIEQ